MNDELFSFVLELFFESLKRSQVTQSCLLHGCYCCSLFLFLGYIALGSLGACLCLVGVFSYAAVAEDDALVAFVELNNLEGKFLTKLSL